MDSVHIDPRVQKLIDLPQTVQRSPEWFLARQTRITASAVSSLLVKDEQTCKGYVDAYNLHETFEFNQKCCNPYSSKKQFIMSKIKNVFTGSVATFWGQRFEQIAMEIYELKYNKKVLEFGLLPHQTLPWLAASPDGITTDGIMLEIKCPFRRKITGIPPLYYHQQVQIQLEVGNLDFCDFLEIEFIEVSSMDEFMDDSLHDHEVEYKGAYIQLEATPDEFETRKYFYTEKENFNDPVKINEWKNSKTEEIINTNNFRVCGASDDAILVQDSSFKKFKIKTVYWKTRVISNVRITRDKEWFESVKDHLKTEWDSVLDFKNKYIEDRLIVLEEEDSCLF